MGKGKERDEGYGEEHGKRDAGMYIHVLLGRRVYNALDPPCGI